MNFLKLVMFACFALPASADTVTTRDNVSVNGRLIEMKDRVLQLETHSSSKVETRFINIDKVATIEFNSAIYNSAGVPKIFGIAPPSPSSLPSPSQEPAAPGDTVVLRGSDRKECRLIRISSTTVVCDGKNNEYSRIRVIRIQVAPK